MVQLDQKTGLCAKTTLNIIDLAGAERPSSIGASHQPAINALMDFYMGKEPTAGAQGTIINFELSNLRSAVVLATSLHRRGLPVQPPKPCAPFTEYTMGCLAGKALLAMLVTLSPAPGCGWETWYSCQYGFDLSRLRAPVIAQKPKPIHKIVAETKRKAEQAIIALENTPLTGPAQKYRQRRIVLARHLQREAELYRGLSLE